MAEKPSFVTEITPRSQDFSRWYLDVVRRAELADQDTSMTTANNLAVRRALEAAGVEFIDENGSGPGVCLRKTQQHGKRK